MKVVIPVYQYWMDYEELDEPIITDRIFYHIDSIGEAEDSDAKSQISSGCYSFDSPLTVSEIERLIDGEEYKQHI